MDAVWICQDRYSGGAGAEDGGRAVAAPRKGWGGGSAVEGRGVGRFTEEKEKDGMMKRV